jgi:hypothetical protein
MSFILSVHFELDHFTISLNDRMIGLPVPVLLLNTGCRYRYIGPYCKVFHINSSFGVLALSFFARYSRKVNGKCSRVRNKYVPVQYGIPVLHFNNTGSRIFELKRV